MIPLGRRPAEVPEVEAFEDVEHLDEHRAARRRRRHRDHLVAAVRRPQRDALLRHVVLHVIERHQPAVAPHVFGDEPRRPPLVELARPLPLHPREGRGQFRLPPDLALFVKRAVLEEDFLRVGVEGQPLVVAQRAREAERHGEAFGGEAARGLDQLRPSEFAGAVLLQRQLHPGHRPRHAGGAVAERRRALAFDEVAPRVQIDVAVRGGGGHLAVVNRGGAPVAQANQHEAAAAEVARRRVRHRQRERDRDGCVHGVAPAPQNVHARLRSELARRGDHPAPRPHRLARGGDDRPSRTAFEERRERGAGEDEDECDPED
jgi:hypothetical protein